MKLQGESIVGPVPAQASSETFRAMNPATGRALEPLFQVATPADLDRAVNMAAESFERYAYSSGADRAALLRSIARHLERSEGAIVDRAEQETGLPLTRLQAELKRTADQLELFAELVEEGSWVDARIDRAAPDRTPAPKPDVRSMLRPVGPVAVFGASNFPLAFSVAGNDTAAALAAGNPVVVKAHPCHPGTSELVGRVVRQAIQECHLPCGMFSVLLDGGIDVGSRLVEHPLIKAVGFTGSREG